jgi:hypothetical protein
MSVDLSKPVLVVEDSQTTGQIMRNLLMLIGFNTSKTFTTWLLRSAGSEENSMRF